MVNKSSKTKALVCCAHRYQAGSRPQKYRVLVTTLQAKSHLEMWSVFCHSLPATQLEYSTRDYSPGLQRVAQRLQGP